jgi:predicted nuclease with TOPRIM domain
MEPSMIFHPYVLAAHAEFGGDLESMQKCYEWYDLKAKALLAATEIEALRRENQELRAGRDEWEALATEFKGLTEEWQARADALEAENKELRRKLAWIVKRANDRSDPIAYRLDDVREEAEDAIRVGKLWMSVIAAALIHGSATLRALQAKTGDRT